MPKYEQDDYALYSDRSSWHKVDRDFERGEIQTDHGYALAFVSHMKGYENTMIEMVKDGRCYRRRWSKPYSRQYAVTLAKQFADDLFTEED